MQARAFSIGFVFLLHSIAHAQFSWKSTLVDTAEKLDLTVVSCQGKACYALTGGVNRIFKSEDGWATHSRTVTSPSDVVGMTFLNEKEGFISGPAYSASESSIWSTLDGGTTWTKPENLTLSGAKIYAMSFSDSTLGFAVGAETTTGYGTIARTKNRGIQWDPIKVGGPIFLCLSTPGNSLVYAGGIAPNLWISKDSGKAWETKPVKLEIEKIRSLSFVNPQIGFAACDYAKGGAICKTVDSAHSWTCQYFENNQSMNSIQMINDRVGFAAGGSGILYSTTDQGNTWVLENSGTKKDLHSISWSPIENTVYIGAKGGVILSSTLDPISLHPSPKKTHLVRNVLRTRHEWVCQYKGGRSRANGQRVAEFP